MSNLILYNTTTRVLTTTASDQTNMSIIIGYVGIGVAVLFFGIFNLPVKHFPTGDGMFFQLLVGLGIWSVSLAVHCVRGFPEFYALPMLGGFFWATANLQTVPTIKLLGIGISQTLNNLISLVFGWAYARFGWFGIKPEVPRNTFLNYLGVTICALSVIIYFFVEVETTNVEENDCERAPILNNGAIQRTENSDEEDDETEMTYDSHTNEFFDRMGIIQKKVFGCFIAIIGGVFFGSTFAPVLYCQSNYMNASQNGNDYAFSLCTGILLSSMFYFIIYCIYKRNRPKVYPELILPSFTTGWLWNIGNTAYFVATNSLSQAITFPISFSGPSIIASILALLYKEIRGTKNILVLFFGISITLAGIIICSLSF